MSRIHRLFPPGTYSGPLPERLNNPFRYRPHELCLLAAEKVMEYLDASEDGRLADEGKMFGVLIIRESDGTISFLAAFSGLLGQSSDLPYFVPPIYDLTDPEGFFKKGEAEITRINQEIIRLKNSADYTGRLSRLKEAEDRLRDFEETSARELTLAKSERALRRSRILERIGKAEAKEEKEAMNGELQKLDRESMFRKAEHRRKLKAFKDGLSQMQKELDAFQDRIEELERERKHRSADLQERIFKAFRIHDSKGEVKDILRIFREAGAGYPPGGTGECSAPKLFQYAFIHALEPIAIAEFWYGRTNISEMREQGRFYPACTGKCGPLLKYMLGPEITECTPEKSRQPEIIYEDRDIVIVGKPCGYLSVPGRTPGPSVYSFIRSRYPEADGPLITHRLDMDTSGLLIAALNPEAFNRIREQFESRSVLKTYRAIVEGNISLDEGVIDLPISTDYVNRPRQKVDPASGKEALTSYRVVRRFSREEGNRKVELTEVLFYPRTGRTHQLRVHSAHPDGLGCPILGDPLYGRPGERMFLHAERIEFIHPVSGKRMVFSMEPDFPL